MPTLLTLANLLIVPGAVLLLPIAVTLWFLWVALRADEAKQKLVWAGYRSFGRFILVVTVAAWWAIWDFAGRSSFVSIVLRRWPRSLGCVWIGVFLWRGQQFVVWLIAPVRAPSDVTPPLTSTWQRLLLSIICLLGAAICAVGVYLSRLWPEQWQAGLVFVLSGLLVLAPVTIKEIKFRSP